MVQVGEKSPASEGGGERFSRFWRNVHALAALAIGGFGLAFNSGVAVAIGVWEGLHAGFWEGSRRFFKRNRERKLGQAALAGT